MDRPCLVHELTYTSLANLKSFQGVCLRLKLLASAIHPSVSEIDLPERILSLRVLGRVNLTKYLQISQLIFMLLAASRIIRTLSKLAHVSIGLIGSVG